MLKRKKKNKLDTRMKELKDFLELPQEERINFLQSILLDKASDKGAAAKDVSSLARAYFESTNIQKEDSLKFAPVSPEDLREDDD